jgi:DNA (cytosine-5)-methyltransferase 1
MIISILQGMKKQFTNLRDFRRQNKIKQRDLADALQIPLTELSMYERGFSQLPSSILSALPEISDRLSQRVAVDPLLCGEGYVTSKAETGRRIDRSASLESSKLTIMDLFCGIGGFSHGFEKTGQFQVATGVDLLGDRLETFCANHSTATAYGIDIRHLTIEQIERDSPRPFVIVGGPPCQGFSSLRPFRNVEWNDPRNNLGEEFGRIVSALQPDWIVFENVVGLLTHARGAVFKSICSAFEELGYRTSARVINCAHFGLPQKRERLVLIGNRKRKAVDWPKPTHNFAQRSMAGRSELSIKPENGLFGLDLNDAVTFSDATYDLPPLRSGEKVTRYLDTPPVTEYQRTMRAGSNKLTLHESTRHSEKMLEIIRYAGANINALPPGMVTSGFSSCYSRLAADEPSTTITVNFVHPASNRCIHPEQDRALTPREGARLQSFEDTFQFMGTRSQTVKQIGNAVPPLLGTLIAETILRSD